jgi:molybdenum cofactor cytidylyltransferase
MHSTGDISFLVLAAGRGTRFDPTGNRFKLLEKLPDGQTVIQATCEACIATGYETIVICGAHRNAIATALHGLDVRLETCSQADAGMGATLKYGMTRSSPATGWIVMLGDMPGIGGSTIQAVITALKRGASLVRPYFAGQPGHPVGISRQLEREFLTLPDSEGGATVFRAQADHVVRIQTNDGGCVYDIDFPEDIRRLPDSTC